MLSIHTKAKNGDSIVPPDHFISEMTGEMIDIWNEFVMASEKHNIQFTRVEAAIGTKGEFVVYVDIPGGISDSVARHIYGGIFARHKKFGINYNRPEMHSALELALMDKCETVAYVTDCGFGVSKIKK